MITQPAPAIHKDYQCNRCGVDKTGLNTFRDPGFIGMFPMSGKDQPDETVSDVDPLFYRQILRI
jgi:hypothetical protein